MSYSTDGTVYVCDCQWKTEAVARLAADIWTGILNRGGGKPCATAVKVEDAARDPYLGGIELLQRLPDIDINPTLN